MNLVQHNNEGALYAQVCAERNALRDQNARLLTALRNFEAWYTERAKKLPGAWPEVVLAARAVIAQEDRS
jgi:hypothetical protein